jgi:hypothetical protein
MPKNIKQIKLWEDNPRATNSVPLVKIEFNLPCTWTVLHIEDLKNILREWIKGEEKAYPQELGFQGRWLLFEEIKKVFEENDMYKKIEEEVSK